MFGKESQYGTYALRAFVLRTVNGVKAQQRPQLVCEATPESIARVKKFMDERDGTRITARSVARELDGLLSYGSKMLPARPIDGGWEAQRLSFVLAVEHVSPIGVNSIYNIAGYTNRMPVQLADRIDWSGVIFYVNSCLVEHASVTRTVDGDRVHRRLEAAEHLIFDAVLASGVGCGHPLFRLRLCGVGGCCRYTHDGYYPAALCASSSRLAFALSGRIDAVLLQGTGAGRGRGAR
jgi:hypothetical protein